MRRQQAANSLLILALVGGAIALAALFIATRVDWRRPAPLRAPATETASAPVPRPAAPAKALPASPAVPAPVAVIPAAPGPVQKPQPAQPLYRLEAEAQLQQSQSSSSPEAPARPRRTPPASGGEPQRLGTAASLADYAGGPGAKRMLNTIKCFDEFSFDYERGGRQYFSALCKGGNRMQVSCIGSGCRIEYAPAPSHLP
jgi:hypothetical protein